MAWAEEEPLDEQAQRSVSPQRVGEELRKKWPDHALTKEIAELLTTDEYEEWRVLRNMLAHRTAPFRDYRLVVGGDSSVTWRVGQRRIVLDEHITAHRRRFLAGRFQALSNALTAFNPERELLS